MIFASPLFDGKERAALGAVVVIWRVAVLELLKAPGLQDASAGRPVQVKVTELSAKFATVSAVDPELPGEAMVMVVGFADTAGVRPIICAPMISDPLT